MNNPAYQAYDKDFYAWAIHTAELLRQGKFNEVDIENVAEEIESMGRSDKRSLTNRLAVLMAHLLKWKIQPERRSRSWKLTVKEQRIRVTRLLKTSPSLKHEVNSTLSEAYEQAVVIAARQTELDESVFPEKCPFSLNHCLDEQFFPE
jgi:Domain of unknown function DUF29.